ncbi:MAG TPA: tRNA lysidine(34) synthetase TilS [Candidatus Yaniella excrementigallinarum]|nr:tRNA lysidine(34) synthetase TilS [Candidatus Yaniella excrementigallinarum]
MPQGPPQWPPKSAWPAAMHNGIAALKTFATQWHNDTDTTTHPIAVAVSGGADSLALAVLAAETQRVTGTPFGAIVLDHQLQEVTAEVARATAVLCRGLGLEPVATCALEIRDHGEGLEASARRARYAAFVELATTMQAAGVLTAHTANDQAEQVLLGLARGSGLRSIAGIRKQRTHKIAGHEPIHIGRPLLDLTRKDTEAICAWAGIQYFEDPMNQEHSIARIRVRQHLLPALLDPDTGLGPGVFSGLVTTAALAADDTAVLEQLAEQTYHSLGVEGQQCIEFPLRQLQKLQPAILRRVVALAVQHFGAPTPSAERLAAVQTLVWPPVGKASSAGPIQLEGHLSVYRKKDAEEYAKLLVIRSHPSE